MAVEVGSIEKGKVSGITNFGAFIDLEKGGTGLVHISEVASEYVKDVNDFLKNGQEVRVKVTAVEGNGKISLSIKKAVEEERRNKARRPMDYDWNNKEKYDSLSFEERMNKFKQDSEEKMASIRRGSEGRRASRRG